MTADARGAPTLRLDLLERGPSLAQVSWDADRAATYALGVGCGLWGSGELCFTSGGTADDPAAALPTFPTALRLTAPLPDFGPNVPRTALVQAGQSLLLPAPFPPAGEGVVSSHVVALHDQGSGVVALLANEIRDRAGLLLARVDSTTFVRGARAPGTDRLPSPPPLPDRIPDQVVELPTLPGQALVYRLSGDSNPLHVDPAVAARAGFDRPILQGLCTFGIAGRALLLAFDDRRGERLQSLSGRFRAPVVPGATLATRIWLEPGELRFETVVTGSGELAISDGTARLR